MGLLWLGMLEAHQAHALADAGLDYYNHNLDSAPEVYGRIVARLAGRRWMLGDRYTLVDMAVWGWARAVPFLLGAEAWQELSNVKRLLDEVNARPAAQRVEPLKAKHAYKTEMDDDAKNAMFPQNARLASKGAA